jgi:hypothetical protein
LIYPNQWNSCQQFKERAKGWFFELFVPQIKSPFVSTIKQDKMVVFLIGAFYIGWLLLTCANQPVFKTHKLINRQDLFRLVPVWTFFAPNPGVSDFNLLSRVKLDDGTITTFEEIPLRSKKELRTALFNPERRLQKALNDHARTILAQIDTEITEENRENIKLTFSYISVLNYCAKLPLAPHACAVQFIILESFGYRELMEPRLILNSDFHRL